MFEPLLASRRVEARPVERGWIFEGTARRRYDLTGCSGPGCGRSASAGSPRPARRSVAGAESPLLGCTLHSTAGCTYVPLRVGFRSRLF